jgi:hypothetical protein
MRIFMSIVWCIAGLISCIVILVNSFGILDIIELRVAMIVLVLSVLTVFGLNDDN